ncbi:MAG: hypothetical protein CME61_06810, partial [Halobacteriovoraceae bacterium]|nr:hypothetical protein [Halobacteriovoraceae bacterium]
MNYSSIQNIKFDELKTVIAATENEQILLIVDSEIQKNYLDLIKEIQDHSGKDVLTYISTSGEPAKSFSEFEKMSNFFLEKG